VGHGIYSDSFGGGQAFVISEVNGTWGTAEEVPGTAALNQGGFAYVGSVSCASPGNCAAGGTVTYGEQLPRPANCLAWTVGLGRLNPRPFPHWRLPRPGAFPTG
jgi:hypothetical protein